MDQLDMAEERLKSEEVKLLADLRSVRESLEAVRRARQIIQSLPENAATRNGIAPHYSIPTHLNVENTSTLELIPTSTVSSRRTFYPHRSITGLTGAIVSALEKNRGTWMTPSGVRAQMCKDGFKPTSANFNNTVINMLRKLGERGSIKMDKKGYGSTYAARDE